MALYTAGVAGREARSRPAQGRGGRNADSDRQRRMESPTGHLPRMRRTRTGLDAVAVWALRAGDGENRTRLQPVPR